MQSLAKFLQTAGLIIPPLAMVAQLAGEISTSEMLRFLVMAVGLFLMGYTIQRYRGGAG